MNKIYLLLILTSFLFITASLKGQTNINVNTSKVIASGVSNKYGINLNAGVDHDSNRALNKKESQNKFATL